MTADEAIEAVKRGERVQGKHSIHEREKEMMQPCFHSHWRTIFCNDETDVVECSVCGQQRLARCNFDEEYA